LFDCCNSFGGCVSDGICIVKGDVVIGCVIDGDCVNIGDLVIGCVSDGDCVDIGDSVFGCVSNSISGSFTVIIHLTISGGKGLSFIIDIYIYIFI